MERDMSEEFPEDDLDWEISSLLKPRQKRYMQQETRNFFKSIKKVKKTDDFSSEKKTKRRIDKRSEPH